MVAMLRVVPPRQPSAEVNAERALFASRRHFEVGEAAIEFGVALRCAFIAGAEGTERPNQKEYAEKWRKVARDEYKQCDAAAALALLHARLMNGGEAPAAPASLPEGRPPSVRCRPQAGGGGDPAARSVRRLR